MMAAAAQTMPFAAFEWQIAMRYLRSRRREGFVSVIALFSFLGIMLGVATLIVVMAVMNGFREELYDKILGLNGHMVVSKVGEPFNDYDAVRDRIIRLPGVEQAMPLIESQVLITSPRNALGAIVRGMRASDISQMKLVAGNLRIGTLDGFDEGEGIALGLRLANALGVTTGDKVTLVNPRGQTTVFGRKPKLRDFEVVAVFELGMSEYDKTIAFMPLHVAQAFFNMAERVDVIEVMTNDPDSVDRLAPEIKTAGGAAIFVTDWRQRNETFFTVLEVERNTMFFILSLIIIVAALNIISGIMMLVKDKSRDIAILRTMGAAKGAIMRVFLITGASIGIVGTIAGLVLGLVILRYREPIREFVSLVTGTKVFDPDIYYIARLPAELDPTETGAIVFFAFALSILATLYPSWRASRIDPVKALRYE
ncbi:MAG: lipoprotein-releasing ABC transporter permease subunit [Hyphomicrobiaceae bacterium]